MQKTKDCDSFLLNLKNTLTPPVLDSTGFTNRFMTRSLNRRHRDRIRHSLILYTQTHTLFLDLILSPAATSIRFRIPVHNFKYTSLRSSGSSKQSRIEDSQILNFFLIKVLILV
ncbi:unnamed protein product [Lactuca virosa]|uniref:Uncharacterized protein n=1 Tax=Lactuca virosa TaxID=75947 RepID=A0AAU9N913_9ASTR|nr:unnamed protein product [Lactuca virosa]